MKFRKIIFVFFLFSLFFVLGCEKQEEAKKTDTAKPMEKQIIATVETNLGTFKIKFFPKEAPKTVENFVKLAREGFYDGIKFHRVIKGFMVQTGDPNTRLDDWSTHGMGGPGYTIPDEFNEHKHVRGMVSMARTARPNSAGSQFFIVTKTSPHLDGQYTVFGEVVAGMDVIDRIENVKTDERDHPLKENEVVMDRVVIEEK